MCNFISYTFIFCAQLLYTTQHRTVLIISLLILQTIIIAQVPTRGNRADRRDRKQRDKDRVINYLCQLGSQRSRRVYPLQRAHSAITSWRVHTLHSEDRCQWWPFVKWFALSYRTVVCPVCLWRWCIVAKRLGGSRCHLRGDRPPTLVLWTYKITNCINHSLSSTI